MATVIAVLALALLLTGATTATTYAMPMMVGLKGDPDKDIAQTRLRDCGGGMMQTRQRLHLQECDGNYTASCPIDGQGGPVQAQGQYQNRLCGQSCNRLQVGSRFGLNGAAP